VAARDRLGVTLDVRALFEYPTVNRLARHLCDSHTDGGPSEDDVRDRPSAPPLTSNRDDPDAVLSALRSGAIGLEEAAVLLEGAQGRR
jgi:hypothetical protein